MIKDLICLLIGLALGASISFVARLIQNRHNTINLATHTFSGKPRFHTHEGDNCQHCLREAERQGKVGFQENK